jgi:prokaryotic ubiquitin-like protein Pup
MRPRSWIGCRARRSERTRGIESPPGKERVVPEQEQKRIQRKSGGGGEDAGQVQGSSKAAELKDEMDEILDEIDSVLEENAEEFVKSYVQKGGE